MPVYLVLFSLLLGAASGVGAAQSVVPLEGQWSAYRGGAKVADCEIVRDGGRLEFIIKRNPPERSSGRFLNAATVIADAWKDQAVIRDGGRRLDWGSSYWLKSDAPPVVPLEGQWLAYRGSVKVADCEIVRDGGRLEFIIKRNPPERSSGRFLNASTVIADAWKDQAVIRDGGRRLDWGSSYWLKSTAPGPTVR